MQLIWRTDLFQIFTNVNCGSYHDFLDRGLLLTMKLLNKRFYWSSWSHHFESFTIATMTWLTVMEYLCHKWPRICSTCPFAYSWLINGFVTRVTRYVPLVKQELPILQEHTSSPPILVGFVLLDPFFCTVFCRSLYVLLSFFFWPLCCLSFFDLLILITSLWYLQTLTSIYSQYGNHIHSYIVT